MATARPATLRAILLRVGGARCIGTIGNNYKAFLSNTNVIGGWWLHALPPNLADDHNGSHDTWGAEVRTVKDGASTHRIAAIVEIDAAIRFRPIGFSGGAAAGATSSVQPLQWEGSLGAPPDVGWRPGPKDSKNADYLQALRADAGPLWLAFGEWLIGLRTKMNESKPINKHIMESNTGATGVVWIASRTGAGGMRLSSRNRSETAAAAREGVRGHAQSGE